MNHFSAIFKILDENSHRVLDKEPLSVKQTVWSGCSISNNSIYGLVIAVGKDTRLEKNSKNEKIHKQTLIDKRVNFFSVLLFIMMFFIGLINAFF